MRLTYLDDAGLFNAKQEPYVVIAGVLIHGDEQLGMIEDHLEGLVKKHIPEEDREGFAFHATELWSGGRYFARDKWDRVKRLEILSELASIPQKFNVPIVFGYQQRDGYPWHRTPNLDDKGKELTLYSDAFARFCECVEKFMREEAPDENTILIAEDNHAIRDLTKRGVKMFRSPKLMEKLSPLLTYFPFERIRDTIHFAKKVESAHLQIADICTFIIKRHLMDDPVIESFYAQIRPHMVVVPSKDIAEVN